MITFSARRTRNVLIDQNKMVQFIDVTLRGYGQVMFQNNPITGLLFFIAIFLGAYFQHRLQIAIAALVATCVATLTASLWKLEATLWRAGLYSYNGCLVGIGLATFLQLSAYLWCLVIFGAIISVITTESCMIFLKKWQLSVLTAPFVIVTWTLLLASYTFFSIRGTGLPHPVMAVQMASVTVSSVPRWDVLIPDVFRGVSEVFLLSNIVVGILFVIGLAINSIAAAFYALIAAIISILATYLLHANFFSIHVGLYSFSAILTAIALGATFNKPSLRVTLFTIIAIIFTVFVQGALNTALLPLGIPALTMPFVLTTWLFLIPNPIFISKKGNI